MLVRLSVWGEVQICIWPSRCHCYSLSLAPVNPDWFYLRGFTFLVLAHLGSPRRSPGSHKTVVVVAVAVWNIDTFTGLETDVSASSAPYWIINAHAFKMNYSKAWQLVSL